MWDERCGAGISGATPVLLCELRAAGAQGAPVAAHPAAGGCGAGRSLARVRRALCPYRPALDPENCLRALLSDEHFSVDGSLIEAWASLKSFKPKDADQDEPPESGGGRNRERDFHGEKRSNATHASTTDPDARLFRKGRGKEARLGNILTGDLPRGSVRCARSGSFADVWGPGPVAAGASPACAGSWRIHGSLQPRAAKNGARGRRPLGSTPASPHR
jgi:hypothetical protein